MGKYKITFKPSVPKDLLEIPNQDVAKILAKIDSLSDNPRIHGSTKLTGKELYRLRQGNYRILYEIDDAQLEIIIIRIAHRSFLQAMSLLAVEYHIYPKQQIKSCVTTKDYEHALTDTHNLH